MRCGNMVDEFTTSAGVNRRAFHLRRNHHIDVPLTPMHAEIEGDGHQEQGHGNLKVDGMISATPEPGRAPEGDPPRFHIEAVHIVTERSQVVGEFMSPDRGPTWKPCCGHEHTDATHVRWA